MVAAQLEFVGSRLLGYVAGFGQFTRFCLATFGWIFFGSGPLGRIRLLLPQMYHIGTRSLPVVMLVGAFIGMVLGVEIYDNFRSIGQESRVGGIINISVVRHIGPVLAAVMIAGRVGGAVSAELGTMRVTEQIDAMRVMGADPIAYLVVPRVVACVIMVPILTAYSDLMGIWGGYLISVKAYGISSGDYWNFAAEFVQSYDVISGLVKTVFFGLAIGLISCYKGFYCQSGAAGVGRAATDSFVTSFVAIIIMNFFLAKFLKDIYPLFV